MKFYRVGESSANMLVYRPEELDILKKHLAFYGARMDFFPSFFMHVKLFWSENCLLFFPHGW